jgi:transcriptional regulator with XRE-family HTH domain
MINRAATLGEYLKITRTRHGYSLQRVADLTGLEASSIKRIEDGTHATPSPKTLLALASAFDIPVGVLAGFIDSYRQLIHASLPAMAEYLRIKHRMKRKDIKELIALARELGYDPT